MRLTASVINKEWKREGAHIVSVDEYNVASTYQWLPDDESGCIAADHIVAIHNAWLAITKSHDAMLAARKDGQS